jgi:hypothetical protein
MKITYETLVGGFFNNQGPLRGSLLHNNSMKLVLGGEKEHDAKDFRQLMMCLHSHQVGNNMLVMDNETEQIEWNLEGRNMRIKINNVNSEPIMKVQVLTMTESLKLTGISIQQIEEGVEDRGSQQYQTRKRGTRELLGEEYGENHTYLNQTTTLWDIYSGSMEEIVSSKIENIIRDFMGAVLFRNKS